MEKVHWAAKRFPKTSATWRWLSDDEKLETNEESLWNAWLRSPLTFLRCTFELKSIFYCFGSDEGHLCNGSVELESMFTKLCCVSKCSSKIPSKKLKENEINDYGKYIILLCTWRAKEPLTLEFLRRMRLTYHSSVSNPTSFKQHIKKILQREIFEGVFRS